VSDRPTITSAADYNVPSTATPAEPFTTLAPEDAHQPAGIQPATGESRYLVMRPHAKGGLGEVFVARDTELRREVALKEIQARFACHDVSRRRFVLEAEVTGQLEHPGIVPVYGLGMYADGRPYYAMRLIRGGSFQEAIDRFHAAENPNRDPGERRLAFRELLSRFVAVCNAVAFAHSRGVIHRDLKPSNVMLGDFGETLVVDWGLAKPLKNADDADDASGADTGSVMIEDRQQTEAGTILGTPAFMPPEQAAGRIDELGPGADVYGLGAILYYLLTGRRPVEAPTLKETLERVIAGDWQVPQRVKPGVSRPLDAVCRKAMAKQPGDRYGSAKALAADVESWLADEPVSAYREPWSARARRWARRHRTLVTSSVAVLVAAVALLSGAAVLLTSAYENERQARKSEEEQRLAASASAEAEREAKNKAEKRLGQIEKANDILASVFHDLNPRDEGKGGPSLREQLGKRLDLAAEQLDAEAVGDPLAVARLQSDLGNCQRELGHFDKAVPLLEKSLRTRQELLGLGHRDTLVTMNNLSLSYRSVGRLDAAISLLEECLERMKAELDPDHPNTLSAMGNLASAHGAAGNLALALPLYEENLRLSKAKLGPNHRDTLVAMNNLAEGYRAAGNIGLALPLFEEAVPLMRAELGPDHATTLIVVNNLAAAYLKEGKQTLALSLHEECYRLTKAKLGPDHPNTVTAMNNLATDYWSVGKSDLAVPLFEEGLKRSQSQLGADHPDTLVSMSNLARAYGATGKPSQAVPLYEECYRVRKAKLGPDHADTLSSMSNLANAYRAAGKLNAALPLYEECYNLLKAKHGPDHPDTLTNLSNLAEAYRAAKKPGQALRLHEECFNLWKAKLGPAHPDTLEAMNHLATNYWSVRMLDRSIPLFEEAVRLTDAKFGPDHPLTLRSLANLGVNYKDAGRPSEAVPLLERVVRAAHDQPSFRAFRSPLLEVYVQTGDAAKTAGLARQLLAEQRAALPADSPQLASRIARTARMLLTVNAWREAEPILRECLDIRERKEPDDWATFNTRSMLGACLLGQGNFAEAETLLLTGFEGMKRREATIPPDAKVRLSDALERLVQLYDATGKPAEAAKRRAELYAGAEAAPPPRQIGP
jgi:serine/threonine protein kinase